MTTLTFRSVNILIEDLPAAPDEVHGTSATDEEWLMTAPRPLYGRTVDLDQFVGNVAVHEGDTTAIEANYRLDAAIVNLWTREEALACARAYLVEEYGENEAAAVAEDPPILLDTWRAIAPRQVVVPV